VAVVGERAFSVIAGAALLIASPHCGTPWSFTPMARAPRARCWKSAKTRRTEEETATRPDGSETRRDVRAGLLCAGLALRHEPRAARSIFMDAAASGASFAEGDRVTVIYDPANPIRARVVSFMDLWLPSAAAFGVVILFGGSVLLSRWSRRGSAT